MIGLSILIAIGIYALLATSFVKYVFRVTKSRQKRYSAITIAVFLPFWDAILHHPVYWVLSSTVPEVERYQPYEKVEGFYVDFVPHGNIAYNMFLHKTFKNKYSLYFDKGNKKKYYYKASWLNNSKSPTCFQPQASSVEGEYAKYLKNNWCVSVEEIDKSEMTRYWNISEKIVTHVPVLYMNVYIVDFYVSDRNTGENIFRLRDVFVDRSWMTAINFVSGKKSIRSGTEYTYAKSGGYFRFPDYNVIKILDSKELPTIKK